MNFFHDLFKAFSPTSDAYIFMWTLALLALIAVFVCAERWIYIQRHSDYNAENFFHKIKEYITGKQIQEALQLCLSGNSRALPRILCAGIQQMQSNPSLMNASMSQQSISETSALEKRLDYIVMFSNVSTLLGLLGTVYGLIMSFNAVSQPQINAIEKSAMLASGISAAMNSTLVGLSVSVACVMVYSLLRTKVEQSIVELQRFTVAFISLIPQSNQTTGLIHRRHQRNNDEPADTDVTPMLNLMVILIPVLLTSSEFVRVGSIDLNLPETSATLQTVDKAPVNQIMRLDLGVIISSKGFNLVHALKNEPTSGSLNKTADITTENGTYRYDLLTIELAKVKQKALAEIVKTYRIPITQKPTLFDLYKTVTAAHIQDLLVFPDIEDIKIVAEDSITYQTVVAVMDAARLHKSQEGTITLFPNVALAGGIVQ